VSREPLELARHLEKQLTEFAVLKRDGAKSSSP